MSDGRHRRGIGGVEVGEAGRGGGVGFTARAVVVACRILEAAPVVLAGLAGVAGILWFAASTFLGVSFVVFKTGSMAPLMPAGAGAIVRPVAAADIEVGDVVTVQRSSASLPVTHRVVSTERDPDVPGGRVLTLRGDANDVDDRLPYRVTKAKLVVFSMAGLGSQLVLAKSPLALSGTTVLVAGLVTWAFWPRRAPAHRASGRRR